MTRRALIALAAFMICRAAAAQALPEWATRLAPRAAEIESRVPVVDRVVLVPDAATYIDELAKWTLESRWPVLIEDELHAPMFIRRFAPAQVIRRTSVGELPAKAALQNLLEHIVIRAWEGDPDQQDMRAAFAAQNHTPAGIVFTSADDPAWTAAVALAAGRGQPLAWLDGRFGEPDQGPQPDLVERLSQAIGQHVVALGYPAAALGDAIDTITICRDMGGRVNFTPPGAPRPEFLAMTDALGRTQTGERWAFTGWIFGDETRGAYVAMCSLFLPRERAILFNTYSETEEQTRAYAMASPAEFMSRVGYRVSHSSGREASEDAWLRLIGGGVSTDVAIMQTAGNTWFFNMSQGRCHPDDVPLLNEPVALHFTHSWSMQRPADETTVGGQWLAHGVYAYVGSVHEPFLPAFQPPSEFVKRLAAGVPFLVAARHWSGDLGKIWRINTFGDPLMPARSRPDAPGRLSVPAEYGVDLGEHVKALMREIDADESGEAAAEATRTLDLLGHDDVAVQVWRIAEQRGQGLAVARAALGPLFRQRRTSEFMRAWMNLPYRDSLAVDMLWHLMTPRLSMADPDALIQLQSAIRRPHSHSDLGRLAPHLTAAFGQGHTRSVIQREIDAAANQGVANELRKLLEKH